MSAQCRHTCGYCDGFARLIRYFLEETVEDGFGENRRKGEFGGRSIVDIGAANALQQHAWPIEEEDLDEEVEVVGRSEWKFLSIAAARRELPRSVRRLSGTDCPLPQSNLQTNDEEKVLGILVLIRTDVLERVGTAALTDSAHCRVRRSTDRRNSK